EDLPTQRSRVDGNRITRSAAFDFYTTQVTALLGINTGIDKSTDAQLRADLATSQTLREGKEYAAQEYAYLFSVFTEGGFGPGEYRTFVAMNAGLATAETRFNQTATKAQASMLSSTMDTPAARTFDAMQNEALDAIDSPLTVDRRAWSVATTALVTELHDNEAAVRPDISPHPPTLHRNASDALT